MSSLQRRFGLLADLTSSVCHSVLLIVHLLSFIRALCPAHFQFVLVTYWTVSVTLVLCLMVVLRILSSSLTLSILILLSIPLPTYLFNILLNYVLSILHTYPFNNNNNNNNNDNDHNERISRALFHVKHAQLR